MYVSIPTSPPPSVAQLHLDALRSRVGRNPLLRGYHDELTQERKDTRARWLACLFRRPACLHMPWNLGQLASHALEGYVDARTEQSILQRT